LDIILHQSRINLCRSNEEEKYEKEKRVRKEEEEVSTMATGSGL
jgi:hypothetical protein